MQKAAKLAKVAIKDNAAWLEATEARTQSVIARAKRELDSAHPDKVASGLAPYIDVPALPLPPQRRGAFVAHLREIVETSFQNTPLDGSPPLPPEDDADYAQRIFDEAPEQKILDTACIACQGDCCMQGNKTHAFLTVKTIDYVRWRNPEMDEDKTVDMYLSYIPDKSVRDSCVYHGATGCTMDRGIRADICNSFQCGFRKKLAKDYAKNPGHGAVVAGISKDHVEHPEAGADYLRVVSMSEAGDVRVHSQLTLPALDKDAAEG